ncbi:hypothetical protein [Acidisoma sp. C75]
MRRSLFRPVALGTCLVLPLLLAACSGGESMPQSFPPLRYNYLAPISLNVGSIENEVRFAEAQDGSSLDAMSPESPLQAVEQMIQDRLVAAGTGGTAKVIINAASINQVNDTAVGNVSIRLVLTSADGRQRGYTDATVSRTRTMPDTTDPTALRAFLYSMTQELVSAANVELEYQIRHNLAAWLVGGSSTVVGGPAAPVPVQATPLGGPGSVLPATGGTLGAPAPLGSMPTATPGANAITPPPAGTDQSMPGSSLGLPMGNPVPTGQDFAAPAAGTMPPASGVPGAPTPLTPTMPAASGGMPSGTLGTMPVSPSASPVTAPAAPQPAAPTAPMPLTPQPAAPQPAAPQPAAPTAPMPLTPQPAAPQPAAPQPATPQPAAPASSTAPAASSGAGTLPPLPAGITP